MNFPVEAETLSALADVFTACPLDGEMFPELRETLGRRLLELDLADVQLHPESLTQDPGDHTRYYLAADLLKEGLQSQGILLAFSAGAHPQAPVFPPQNPANSFDIEASPWTVWALPFASTDHSNIDWFAREIAPEFLPSPRTDYPVIACGTRHPEISLPAAFGAYHRILAQTGKNCAAIGHLSAIREMATEAALAARDAEDPITPGHTQVSIRHMWFAGVWAAIRAGYRAGYVAGADDFTIYGDSEAEKEASLAALVPTIEDAAAFTKFGTDACHAFDLRADLRHPQPYSDIEVEERFQKRFTLADQAWIYEQFEEPFQCESGAIHLGSEDVRRFAVKFGSGLHLHETLYDKIQAVKSASGLPPQFNFEVSLAGSETLTTPRELLFCLHWLKAGGHPAGLIAPNLGFKNHQPYPDSISTPEEQAGVLREYVAGKLWPELLPRVESEFAGDSVAELAHRTSELNAIARYFNATLSIHSGSGKQPRIVELISRETQGRVSYIVSGELQLQLFDVLSEQSPGTRWRDLYDRMVARTEGFAARDVYGEQSALAARCRALGKGNSLGSTAAYRSDGNLFLILWLGNTVGSRDIHSPDGDRRTFKEKLDEVPEPLLSEVRKRNQRYIEALAESLRQ